MAFINPLPEKQNKVNTSIGRFIKLDEGKPVTLQILEEEAAQFYKYWFKDSVGRWVGYASPGYETCPVVAYNKAVGGKESKQYIKPRNTYAVNAFDMTPMIICPECNAAYWPQEKPQQCDSCETVLSNLKPQPLNQVRVLERGYRLFSALSSLSEGTPILDDDGSPTGEYIPIITDSEGNQLGLTEFVVQIIRTGAGQATVTTPIPMLHIQTVSPEDYVDQLHKLPQGADLSSEEVLAILEDNVTLSDIYAARNAEKADGESAEFDKNKTLY